MIPENVTLIVKAPNQQIEDQNVECQSSWTVIQLKSHLCQVYPSKPAPNEQKLIYSGQLLDDHVVLKDVLRTYETQFAHTMHLVCSSKRNYNMSKNTVPAAAEGQPETPPLENQDGVRRRNVTTEQQPEMTRPETRQNDQNHNVEMQNYLSSFANNYGRMPPYYNAEYLPAASGDPASMAHHMMMMQQAYMQYMQQYANLWQAGGNQIPVTQPVVGNEPPPVQPPAREPAAPVVGDDPEERQDWLDHLYVASRIGILLTFLFLYTSPIRLVTVLFCMAGVYLHHIGFFRDANNPADRAQVQPPLNQQQPAEQPQPANAQPQPVGAQPQPANAQPQPTDAQPQPADTQPQPTDAQPQSSANVTINENQQSLLAVSWMIVTSFFTSLIPENNY